jgi:hypothetical protein
MSLQLEIVKLLMQVAWADGEVAYQEMRHVLGWARDADLSEAQLSTIEACLRGDSKLPPPDLGLLRAHRDEALKAVEALIGSDEIVVEDEQDALAQIRELLGG